MKKNLIQLGVGAVGVCVAMLAMAGPATAKVPPEPTWSPQPVVPSTRQTGEGLEVTSAALGALGAFSLAGAGLGITLGVQRRRDRSALHSA